MPELREFEHLLNDCGDGLWIDDVMVVSPGDKNGSGLFLQIPFLDLREGLTNKGDADKNLDWLCREAQAFTILNGTERAEGNLDSFFVVPANV